MSDLIELRDQLEQQLQHLPKELRLICREIFTGIEAKDAEIERLTTENKSLKEKLKNALNNYGLPKEADDE